MINPAQGASNTSANISMNIICTSMQEIYSKLTIKTAERHSTVVLVALLQTLNKHRSLSLFLCSYFNYALGKLTHLACFICALCSKKSNTLCI